MSEERTGGINWGELGMTAGVVIAVVAAVLLYPKVRAAVAARLKPESSS